MAIYGEYNLLYENSRNLFVYERKLDGKRILVITSFSENPVKFSAPIGYDLSQGELVLQNYDVIDPGKNEFMTKPYEARVYYFDK